MDSLTRTSARTQSAIVASSKPPPAHVDDQAAAAIPAGLKLKRRWLIWRWYWNKQEKKWKKPPIDPKTGGLANCHDSKIWLCFDSARRLSVKLGDGIGYKLDDDEVGIDCDDCFDPSGNLKPDIKHHVDAFDSYTERSPRDGLHTIIIGKKPTASCRVAGVEVYDISSNYMTFTGNHLEGTPQAIECRQQALDALFNEPVEEVPTGKVPTGGGFGSVSVPPVDLGDEGLLERARHARNGAAFSALFDDGTASHFRPNGKPDRSKTHLNLMGRLAWWTDGDRDRMERLFSMSAFRDDAKWQRADYRKLTLDEAIAKCRGGFKPRIPAGSKESTNGKAHPPDKIIVRTNDPDDDSPINRTELGNARRLVKLFGHRLRYCKQLGYWLVFDGTRWHQDHTGQVWRCAKATVRYLGKEAALMTDDTKRQAMLRWAIESEKKKIIQAMIDLAWSEPGIAILPEDLDRDPYLLNCLNGTVDLRSGLLREHRPEDLITKITLVAYRPGAQRQRWETTLSEIHPEPEMQAYVKRAAGYSASGDTGEHALFIAYGKGRNGKNTVLDPIATVLHDYATTSDPKVFLRTGKNEHPTGLANLFGRRLVITDEVDEGEQLAEALVKRLTGNPKITARFVCKDNFEFDVTCKIWMPVNHKPDVRGRDEGIWSRIRVVPFDVYFPPEKRVKNLAKTLVKEEGEGILAWLVEGHLEWQRKGLKEPPKILDAMKEYRREQDVMTAFLEECCISWLDHEQLREQAKEKTNDLYARYSAWCKENGEKNVLTGRKFGSEMEDRGYQLRPSNGVHYRHGIALNPATTTATPQRDEKP